MSVNEYKHNRSLSESDLTNVTLDNSKIDFLNNQPTGRVIRTKVVMEEIVDSRFSLPIRRYSSIREIRDNKSSAYFYESCQTDGSKVANTYYEHHYTHGSTSKYQQNVEPMEIDYNYCDNPSTNNYEELNADQAANCRTDGLNRQRRYEALGDLFKQQKYANLTQGKGQSSYINNVRTNPIVKSVDNSEQTNTNLKLAEVKPVKNVVTLKSICSVLFLLASVVIYILYGGESICADAQMTNISYSLRNRMHEQKHVVETVIRNIKLIENWEDRRKVLVFLGPPGVGKTFLANIIKENLKHRQVSEMFGKELLYKIRWEQISKAIDEKILNLIVVDDIVKEDVVELMAFAQALPKNAYILVLSIFNFNNSNNLDEMHNPEDVEMISKSFEKSNLDYELVVYEEFNDQQVRNWLIKQLIFSNISKNLHNSIADNVLKGHDAKRHGLKGLNAKLLYQIERFNQ